MQTGKFAIGEKSLEFSGSKSNAGETVSNIKRGEKFEQIWLF